VQIVTVCADTPEEIREGPGEHGLKARMLSDRDLVVTATFGLRNQGIHSGPPIGGAEALPVPTSLLIDGNGKVLWMDQSEDYQRRSGPGTVLAALRTHLD
jgi:peroxiredoxin